MKDCQDAFGHAMCDYLQGTRSPELDRIGCKTWFSEYEDWFDREKKAMTFVRGEVLDIGCGAGRHALYLQSRRHDVLGIDNSPLAMEVCRRRGVRRTKVLSITQVGPELGVFDTILMLGNNFGLMASYKRARWLLRRFKRITTAEARILAGSGDPGRNSDRTIHGKMEMNRRQGRMPGQFRRRGHYKDYLTPEFDWLFVSKAEMVDIVDGTGWQVSDFLEDETDAYVAVIEKKPAEA